MAARGTLEERFWRYVDKIDGPLHLVHGQCWVWIGYRNKLGYGRLGAKDGSIY
jgi:hypothetical protein